MPPRVTDERLTEAARRPRAPGRPRGGPRRRRARRGRAPAHRRRQRGLLRDVRHRGAAGRPSSGPTAPVPRTSPRRCSPTRTASCAASSRCSPAASRSAATSSRWPTGASSSATSRRWRRRACTSGTSGSTATSPPVSATPPSSRAATAPRPELLAILADPDVPLAERQDRLLSACCQLLGLEIGLISRYDGDVAEVLAARDPEGLHRRRPARADDRDVRRPARRP